MRCLVVDKMSGPRLRSFMPGGPVLGDPLYARIGAPELAKGAVLHKAQLAGLRRRMRRLELCMAGLAVAVLAVVGTAAWLVWAGQLWR